MKLKLKIKGKKYHIEISEKDKEIIKIKVEDKEFVFKKEEKREPLIAKTSLPKRNFSEKKITASIAGTISEIFVKEGEFVKKNQKVILLSAMKMENEIVSDFKGRVKKILAQKNQEVKSEDVLIVLD